LNLSGRSFISSYGRPLLAVAFLAAAAFFFHLMILVPLEESLAAKETSWQAERPKIGRLTRLKTAHEDLLQFWRTLPDKATFPQLISFISESAAEHRLFIPAISYQPDKVEIPGMVKVVISFNVKGSYQEIRKLIDELERSRYFLIIENLVLASSAKEGEIIQLQLRIAAYLRDQNAKGEAGGAAQPGPSRTIRTRSGPDEPVL